MKTYKIFILTIMTGLVFSCSDSFLELTPQQSVSDTDALLDLDGYESSITGIYNKLSGAEYYGRYMIMIPDVLADDVKQNSQANRIVDYAEHIQRVSDGDALNLWGSAYEGINAANAIINSETILADAVLDEQNHIVGEAYALRGLIYFDLVRMFAQQYNYTADASHLGVPIVLNFDLDNEPARSTVAEVYEQIISDMTTGISLMSDSSRSGNSNTLSPNATRALLAKVYLFKEDWNNAEAMASSVIDSGDYSLISNDNYYDLWTTDNSAESIFEISMTETDNVGGNGIAGLYLQAGFGDYLPSNDVVDLYPENDARLSTFEVDPLLTGEFGPYRMIKYADINGFDNVKVVRLAEMYLIRAEARAEIGTDIAGAQDDLDMVRQRAMADEPDNADTGDALKDAIFIERRLELAFEGQRLWDLMRNQMDIVRTNCTAQTCTIPYGADTVIMPIPQDETDVNPNIEQNPGY
ncbi:MULTISPECIES: RagB/SusD family nutrient uptake outer membrane protein [unclassified Maribacter]|uniref:RagB/SusD family nutrient uptake outer membrane protein n=2 Tax=Maribacter TaxID=252356 RepID=UPI002580988E|nr:MULTISPECIES: RagB/SusD family nutrient uptake outer membrane protein [unclassified Maribacter]